MLTSKSKHACMYSILSLTSKALNQGVTDRVFLLQDGTDRVLAKKCGYWDGLGGVVRKVKRQKTHI